MSQHVLRPEKRSLTRVSVIAVLAGLAVSSGLIWQASYSAFSSTTSNPTNNWTAGTVALTDNDSNAAMFTATGLKPGSTGQSCITVTSTGSLASAVKLYTTASSFTQTNGLADNMTLAVTQGTGSVAFGNACTNFTPDASNSSVYSGTLTGFSTTATNFSNGLGTWTPTGTASESKVYKFVWTLTSSAPSSTQGGTAAIGFTWEAQNS